MKWPILTTLLMTNLVSGYPIVVSKQTALLERTVMLSFTIRVERYIWDLGLTNLGLDNWQA